MGVLVQVRDLPEEAHRTLKARAAMEGRTLSDYLRERLVELAERPTPEEFWRRVAARPTAELDESPAETIRRERDARG
jgi:plasmid stability protein